MAFWKKLIFFFPACCVAFLSASFVLALEVNLPGLGGNPDIGTYICYLFSKGVSIAVSIAVVAVAVGGVYYLVSYGSGKITNEGKEWIKAGITGS